MRTQLRIVLACIASLVFNGTLEAQTTYSWSNLQTSWKTATSWNENTIPNDLQQSRVVFGAQATPVTPDISINSLSVLGIRFDNSGGTGWDLNGTSGVLSLGAEGMTWLGGNNSSLNASLRIAQDQTWDLGSTTVTMNGALSGYGTLTKSGTGTLILSPISTNPNTFFGNWNVTEGTLQLNSTTQKSAGYALRSNSVNLAVGTSLTVENGADMLRVGALSGGGSVGGSGLSSLYIHALADSTFSGSIAIKGSLLHLRGANGTTQTLNGNVTGIVGTSALYDGATLRLSGTGDAVSGVLGSSTIDLRGGALVLDNTLGNTSATQGRLADTVKVTGNGGLFSLLGHQTGTVENLGVLSLNTSMNTISVTNSGGGATLAFQSFGISSTTPSTVDFVGKGVGTLGGSGDAPRITFTSAPGLTNGVIASATGSNILGFATVNGSDFASYGPNGVVAVNSTSVSGNLVTAPTLNAVLTDNSATLGASNVAFNTLKLAPGGSGYTLDLTGSGSLSTAGILLTGTNDFTIQNTGSATGGLIASGPRFITVSNPDTTLNIGVSLASGSNAITKSGEGILALTGASNQLYVTSPTNITIAGGVLRGSLTNLGGGSPTGGKNTTLHLRGGVLEIRGGGTLYRALDLAGTTAGGGITFDQSSSDRGHGGFSAINGNATVTLTTALGGSTVQPLVWSDTHFLADGMVLLMGSTKSDSQIELTNPISLGTSSSAYVGREVRVIDNPNSSSDLTRLSGVISGPAVVDLLKTGQGTLELTGNNSYSGNTLVIQGTLRVSSPIASTGSGQVLVMQGAQLEGTGKIVGRTVVSAGGTIRGGFVESGLNASARGSLVPGNTDLYGGPGSTGATLAVDLNGNASPTLESGQNSTLALAANTFNLDTTAGKVNILLLNDAELLPNQSYTMTLVTGNVGSFYRNGSLATGGNAYRLSDINVVSGSGSQTYSLEADALRLDSTGSNLILTVGAFNPVPEPTTVLAVGVVGLALFGWVRRRRNTDKGLSLSG